MKTWKDVTLEAIYDKNNIAMARFEAGRNKEDRTYVKSVSEEDVAALTESIANGTYKLSKPYCFTIQDKYSNKIREIESPAFKDQIIHHAIVQVLEPHLLRLFHPHQMASIPKRGIEKGRKVLHKWAIHNSRQSKVVVQCDIKKYYDNINVKRMLKMLSKYIRDKRVIALIGEVFQRIKDGICLGSYISQWMANFYIAEIIREVERAFPRCHIMVYMDNITFTCPSKKLAKGFLDWLKTKIGIIGLKIKEAGSEMARFFLWKNKPINAVGYKSYYTGKQILRNKIYLAITRMISKVKKVGSICKKQARSILSRYGFVKHSSCIYLKHEIEKFIKTYNVKYVAHHEHGIDKKAA